MSNDSIKEVREELRKLVEETEDTLAKLVASPRFSLCKFETEQRFLAREYLQEISATIPSLEEINKHIDDRLAALQGGGG